MDAGAKAALALATATTRHGYSNPMEIRLSVLARILLLVVLAASRVGAMAPAEDDLAAYLLVYFKDETHSIHFALSADGYHFADVNEGRPVIDGAQIAEQKGVRDPHIMRGPDGAFYMAATDLHIYAKAAGYRSSHWQRDASRFGWGNNRAVVLMKSQDLIHWTHTVLRVDKAFPGFEEIGCVWAPELIYDEKEGKFMVYFSLRYGNGNCKVYYAYLNDAFNRLETKPKVIFEYPRDVMYIDSNITKVGEMFHIFYVPHDGTPGIKQAVSTEICKGYVYDPEWVDSEDIKCEAPNVWKRIGEEKWVLMYDIYGLKPPNFGFRETTDFKTFTDLGRFNEGPMKASNFQRPKHGSVIRLTKQEAEALARRWGNAMSFD